MKGQQQPQQQHQQQSHIGQLQHKLSQLHIQQQKLFLPPLQQQQSHPLSSQLPYFIFSFQASSSLFPLIGKCQQMSPSLSSSFQDNIDELEKYPLTRIKKYFRNQQYSQKSINQLRSPQTLDRTVNYLIENHFILLIQNQKRLKKVLAAIEKWKQNMNIKNNINSTSSASSSFITQKITQIKQIHSRYGNNYKKLRKQVIIFLQDRLKQIRCQLFASQIIYPSLTLKLIKCHILLYTLAQQDISLTGLQQLLHLSICERMSSSYKKQLHQSLLIAILSCKSQQLSLLLHNHCQKIFSEFELSELLELRLSTVQSFSNYHKYFSTLRDSQSALIKLLLWHWIDKIRQNLQKILIASKQNVKKGWLNFLMGFKQNQNQSHEIINLYQNKSYVQNNNKNNRISKKQQLLQWIKEDKLFQILLQ